MLIWRAGQLYAQPILTAQNGSPLPISFVIGENEEAYSQLMLKYETGLIEICEDDMDLAFQKWSSMLMEMEAYAERIDFDIKGVKLWLNVFWDADGNIKHIGYYLKGNSRNLSSEELSAFFSSFSRHYRFPLVADKAYSHYGSASFPTHYKVELPPPPAPTGLVKEAPEKGGGE